MSKSAGRHFTRLFEKRQKGDYDDFFDNNEQSAIELWEPTKDLILEIQKMLQNGAY